MRLGKKTKTKKFLSLFPFRQIKKPKMTSEEETPSLPAPVFIDMSHHYPTDERDESCGNVPCFIHLFFLAIVPLLLIWILTKIYIFESQVLTNQGELLNRTQSFLDLFTEQ
jgi:hypothetical protein